MTPRDIPVYLCDEHNEAFFYWQKARREAVFSGPLDLFHVDAHADMARPSEFRTPLHLADRDDVDPLEYYGRFARDELTIANFIYPAVLGGLVKNVHFIYPAWRKFKPRRSKIQIASVFGEGKIIKYPAWLARDTHAQTVNKALPDLKAFAYISQPAERMPGKRTVILDIDFDYFACRDSVQNTYEYRLSITPDQYRNRDAFLADPTLSFSRLEFAFQEDDGRHSVVISFRKGPDQTHLPGQDEIDREVTALVDTLVAHKIKPALITMCRSRISGFCPTEYVAPIEAALLNRLAAAFPIRLAEVASPANGRQAGD